MEADKEFGPWTKIRVLGRGGFGLVTLWKNDLTDQHIAIKCLRDNELKDLIKPERKERWCKEVEIMKKLKHKNIVSAVEVPEPFNSIQSNVPLLGMEYCRLGDLRQVLIKPENCCGLKESMIFDILRDISNGLSYLHSCKIIHRDVKPDNIVLQMEENKIVYKLIDLGYAKELDQNSLCESFVGTVQYIAPELFFGKPYTCSADYWSFGQVAHEIITGHRPFLPGSTPAIWMKHIQNKKRSVISIFEGMTGDIIYSSSLSKVNYLSSCLRSDFEKWLQFALDWDGKARGRDPDTMTITFFSTLKQILEKQVVKIFSLPSYEVLSYIVNRDTSVANLQSWITKDTGLESDDQILLVVGGKTLNPKANLLNSLPPMNDPDEVSLYLYTAGLIKMRSKTVKQPFFVQKLLEDPKILLKYPLLKRCSSDSIFLLQSEAALYQQLLLAVKTKVENIQQRNLALEALYEDVAEEWQQVDAYAQFFTLSQKADLENYIELRKAGVLCATDVVQKWIRKASELDDKLSELKSSTNKEQQKLEIENAKANAKIIINELLPQFSQSPLQPLVIEGLKLYEKIQKIPKDVHGHALSNTDMVRVLYKSMEASAKALKSSQLCELFLKLFECEDHLAKLISPLTVALKGTKIMRQIIETTQKERQRDIWSLLKKVPVKLVPEEESKKKEVVENGKFSPFHIPKTVHNDLASPLDENILRPSFIISGPVSNVQPLSSPFSSATFPKKPELEPASYLIEVNNELRYRTQELAESCSSLVKDINSLNWNFLMEG